MKYHSTKKVKVLGTDKIWYHGLIIRFYEFKDNGIRTIRPRKQDFYMLNRFSAWEVVEK